MPCIHDNCGSIGREKKGVDLGNDIENDRMEIRPVKTSSVGVGDAIGFSEKTGNVKSFVVVSFKINPKKIN